MISGQFEGIAVRTVLGPYVEIPKELRAQFGGASSAKLTHQANNVPADLKYGDRLLVTVEKRLSSVQEPDGLFVTQVLAVNGQPTAELA